MSVLLRGFGLDVDSQSAIVAFGLTLDLESPTLADLEATGIENWYAIDYRVGIRRPVTQIEWRRIKRLWRVWERSRIERERKEAQMRAQADKFTPIVAPVLVASRKAPPRRRGLHDPKTGRYAPRP